MKIIFLGDVVGKVGRQALYDHLPQIQQQHQPDLTIVNGENASHGFGISPDVAEEFFRAGVDVITTGNHAFDRNEIIDYMAVQKNIIRPLNMVTTIGEGVITGTTKNGQNYKVINIMGQLFMGQYNDPFTTLDSVIGKDNPMAQGYDAIVVDVHAEASSEKQAIGHYLDGRTSLVIGTHTHVPTSDGRVLSHGTAYQSDAGMCGDYDSIIGMEKNKSVARFLRQYPLPRLEPATGSAMLWGAVVETDKETGLAQTITQLKVG